MAGPTFILSIWVLVDGALGTEDSTGAAVHTVGTISKMGTLSTSIRALGRREKVGKNGIPRSISYLPARSTQPFGLLHPQHYLASLCWPCDLAMSFPRPPRVALALSPLEILVLLLYRAVARGSTLHGSALRVAGEAFSLMGKLTRLPAVGGKGRGSLLSSDLYVPIPQPQFPLTHSHQGICRKLSRGTSVA